MKSGDFQVGGAIRDDSIVSIMSMGYEGCCFQEESMETQRQGHGVLSCLINLITWIYNFNQEIKSDQHWAS